VEQFVFPNVEVLNCLLVPLDYVRTQNYSRLSMKETRVVINRPCYFSQNQETLK